MNSFNYMDKQITEFSNSKTKAPFFNHQDDGDKEEAEINASNDQDHGFHVHPFRSLQSSSKPLDDSHLLRGWSSMDPVESRKLNNEKVVAYDEKELISRIDQKLKEHTDDLLHSVEHLSARVSQMESRVRQVENSFDGLKESIEFNQGKMDGKLRELENILLEVHSGIKDLRDKQEIAEAQARLAKLQMLKESPKLVNQNTTEQPGSDAETLSSVSQQSNRAQAIPSVSPQPAPAFSSNMAYLPPQNHPSTTPAAAPQPVASPSAYFPMAAATAPQFPSQLPQTISPAISQQEAYYPFPGSTPGIGNQQFVSPMQQSQQSLPQPYQSPNHLPLNPHQTQYPQVRPPISGVDPRVSSYHPEQPHYGPTLGLQKSAQPPDGLRPPQVFNVGPTQRLYEQPSNFFDSESPAHLKGQGLQPRGYVNTVDYNYSPAYSSSPMMKPLQPSSSSPVSKSEFGNSQLPTARALPHAIPTASAVDSGSSSGGNGNRVPVDDVIDNVVAMGFRRDTVRATVKKLTENGQSVDLNSVLDKLMNSG